MAITVTPKYGSETYSGDTSGNKTWTVVYEVKGPEVQAYGIEVWQAAFETGIPSTSDSVIIGGNVLHPTSYSVERVAPEMFLVTVTWSFSSSEPRVSKEELDRRLSAYRPYNEQIDMTGQSVELSYSPITLEPIGLGKGITVYEPRLTWEFTVNAEPLDAFYENIGKTNSDHYPPPDLAPDHFRFPPHTLLYLGARGNRSSDLEDYSNLWQMTLTFMYRPYDWRYETWSLTTKIEFPNPEKVSGSSPYYYKDPTDNAEEEVAASSVHMTAEVPLYQKIGDVALPPYSTLTREEVDFRTFQFDWS